MVFKRFLITLIIGFLITALTAPLSASAEVTAATRYVATGGTDSGDCTSSAAPCLTIQYAVNQPIEGSSGDIIKVAQGIYNYNPESAKVCADLQPRAIVCVRNKSLSILGGYTTSDWSTAYPASNPTIIDGQSTYRGVHVHNNKSSTFLDMEGFTIRNCRSTGSPAKEGGEAKGGGMLVQIASITLRDMVFSYNQANGALMSSNAGGKADGSAIRIEASPDGTTNLLQRVTFDHNTSSGGIGPQRGGIAFGALFIVGSTVVIEDSNFINNSAQAGDSGGSGTSGSPPNADALGGGVALENGTLTMRRVRVTGNSISGGDAGSSSGNRGGGAYGAGIFVEGVGQTSHVTLSDCYVANNSGTSGSAYYGGNTAGGGFNSVDSQVTIDRSQFINNTIQGGNAASGGTAGPGSGGGLYIYAINTGMPRATLRNVVIADNYANEGSDSFSTTGNGGGGGMYLQGIGADLTHVTFARNRLGATMNVGQAIYVTNWPGKAIGDAVFNYNIFSDHTAGDTAFIAAVVVNGMDPSVHNSITFHHGLFSGNIRDTNVDPPGWPMDPGTINGLDTMITATTAGYISPGSPNYNYHLRFDSPALDQATDSTTADDFDGQSRPYNAIRDYGADEYWYLPYPFYLPLIRK